MSSRVRLPIVARCWTRRCGSLIAVQQRTSIRWNASFANARRCSVRRPASSPRRSRPRWTSGTNVSAARRALLEELTPVVEDAYAALTTSPQARGPIAMAYRPGWEGELAEALLAHRTDDVRRGVSTTGPQRDEVLISVEGRDTRTRASQGEQRTVALALRLAVHRVVTARRGSAPLLLLDDVFSELDGDRCRALVRNLPEGQTLLTTAGSLPDAIRVSAVVDVGALGSRG